MDTQQQQEKQNEVQRGAVTCQRNTEVRRQCQDRTQAPRLLPRALVSLPDNRRSEFNLLYERDTWLGLQFSSFYLAN